MEADATEQLPIPRADVPRRHPLQGLVLPLHDVGPGPDPEAVALAGALDLEDGVLPRDEAVQLLLEVIHGADGLG